MAKKILLDTNFILSCVRNKIDFVEEILFMGYKILIPEEVIKEIEKISSSKKKLKFREEAKIALKLLQGSGLQKIVLGGGHADRKIVRYAKEHKGIIVGTLDKEIKNKLKGRIMVIREKKRLEVV